MADHEKEGIRLRGERSAGSRSTRQKSQDALGADADRAERGFLSNLVVSAYLRRPLLSISLSYPAIFALGFGCSLSYYGYLRPEQLPDPLRERARVASNTFFRAFDEMMSSDTVDSLLRTTSRMKEVLDLQALSNATLGFTDIVKNRTSLGVKDYLPDWQVPAISQVLGKSERVGIRMAREGKVAKHPVIMVPGIITTGLELWDGEDCIKNYFRQRIWGTTTMLQAMVRDPDCWVRHMSLNTTTGLDPLQQPHFNRTIRVRPSQGFESADFFIGGYWLWGLMIESLADVGYDQNSMYMASYDWRLSFEDMERRDWYFTKLMQQIETLVKMNREKAAIVAHSMGGNLFHYFMQWVTHNVHPNWVHNHVHSVILISSPLLGLPKAYFSLLTGDNRDFATMGTFSAVVNHYFGSKTRRSLWRSCSSLSMIMPIGGNAVWGQQVTGMPLVQAQGKNLTVEEAYDLLASARHVPRDLQRIEAWLLQGIRASTPIEARAEHQRKDTTWGNALATVLPFAPQMKMYALYGVGVSTEYTGALEASGDDVQRPKYGIDREAHAPNAGFLLGDGDYSCPVLSLGFMCTKGWRNEARNPARIPCTVREYKDKPGPKGVMSGSLRGGPSSGDHVDILGNEELLEDLISLVVGGRLGTRVVSDLAETAARWNDG